MSSAMVSSSTSSSFTFALSFPSSYKPRRSSKHATSNSLLDSFHNAQPSCMKDWARLSDQDGQTCQGLAVGCEDGSLYVFHHRSLSTSNDPIEPLSPQVKQSPRTKHSKNSRFSSQNSRSTSPSAASLQSAPFLISPRSRVVSGVSTEQVEAPKNYVDFDDEPDKLKDMLKGRISSPKTVSDSASESNLKTPTPPAVPILEPTPTRNLSKVVTNFTSPNTRPFSAPVSPRDGLSPPMNLSEDLELQYHIIPRTNGAGNAVRSISVLADPLICVVLQESGLVPKYRTPSP